jgi:hypothetical protein
VRYERFQPESKGPDAGDVGVAAAEDDMPVLGLGLCHGLDGRHLSVLGYDYGLPGFCQIMTPTPNEDGMEMRSKNEGGMASFFL